MRILFIDFDGVLHPLDGFGRQVDFFCWVPHLHKLLERYEDVRIVVHSSWRYDHTDEELRGLLGPLGERFIGSVPRLRREHAIQTVLQANKMLLASYLVLDDDAREFSDGSLNVLLCDPKLGISDVRVQAPLAAWLVRTSPDDMNGVQPGVPRKLGGRGEKVLYLEFDGVLHDQRVVWHSKTGAFTGTAGHTLFEHAPALEALLNEFPKVLIVLSTAWPIRLGFDRAARCLPPGLRWRVVGCTFHSKMNVTKFKALAHGQQVTDDILRRRPLEWCAIASDHVGWPDDLRSHVVVSDPILGLGAPGALDAVARVLLSMHSGEDER